MDTHFDSQTTHHHHSSSSLSSCSSSSSSSSSSPCIDCARIVPFPFCATHDWSTSDSSLTHSSDTESHQHLPENGTVVDQSIKQLRFIDRLGDGRTGWREIEERFDQIASLRTGTVTRFDFPYCIGTKDAPDFADELLRSLRGRKDINFGITKLELHYFWCRIRDPSFHSRVRVLFDLCDKNMDGKITKMELKKVILLSASTNKLSITLEEANEYATLIMEDIDHENQGYIEICQLETLFTKTSLTKGSHLVNEIEHNQVTYFEGGSENQYDYEVMSSTEIAFRTYWRRAWIVTLWLLICLGLFVWKFIQYRQRKAFYVMGYCLCTAKGAAETLKFNMALILLPVCRNTITWLRRNRSLNSIIPFNDNINFHKLIAGGIVIGVILHGGTHLTCDFPRIARCSRSVFRRTIASGFQNHQPTYIEILATTEVATGIIMVILMAIAFTLATRLARRQSSSLPEPLRNVSGYNAFWYSHHLFILVYVLLIIHSMFLFLTKNVSEKTTWMYIAVPVLLYIAERMIRVLRSEFYYVEFVKAKTYPGKVLSLKMSKPTDFKYKSGMYIYLQCSQISRFEWHPFSLTSAPEDEHLSVHIKTLGDWSYQIYSLFQEALICGSSHYPKIYIDGPYGASSQDHVKYDIVVLIGLGIGATPFISIVRDIVQSSLRESTVNNYVEDEELGVKECSSKAYLYWVTREHSSFEWFRDAMKEICDKNQMKDMIEIHNYLTSVYQDGDVRSAFISAIQMLHYTKNGVDVISKTPVQTHFGRPNWSKVFADLATRHEGAKIGVFYCGPSVLAKQLQRLCTKFSTKTKSRFVFHKENY